MMWKLLGWLALGFALAPAVSAGERTLLDDQWRFHLGDAADAQLPGFDDSSWRVLDLPHDWGVESAPAADAPSGGDGGYHQTGVGWYRRTLRPEELAGAARSRIEFDGVYQHAEVWLNGERLGRHGYGYTPFAFDLTGKLRDDRPNIIAVRVDNSQQPNSRWHSGSGIYRHVWLRRHGPVWIDPHSVWVETAELSPQQAKIRVHYTVRNEADAAVEVGVESRVAGEVVDERRLAVEPRGSTPVTLAASVSGLQAWTPERPSLQRLALRVTSTGGPAPRTLDQTQQTFGLRTLRLSAAEGLLLNGRPTTLFGGNVHHDHGPLGARSFDAAEARRASLLKAAGFNAVRTSHNPPSEAFLDACDRQGLLVIDEAFDGWIKHKIKQDYGDAFEGFWREELTAMVRRDRRHPCVVMWSIGNEMYERGDESGRRLAREMSQRVKQLDPSRPVTAGVNGLGKRPWSELDPLFAPLDAAGYNYEIKRFEADHARVPGRVMYTSESYVSKPFRSWRAVTDHPYVIGDFVWSAIDYLGEAGIGRVFPPGEPIRMHWEGEHFPWRGAACGDIDLLGRRKPISHRRNIVWDRGERLFASVQAPADGEWGVSLWAAEPRQASWNWDVPPGTPLRVHVDSRWPRVQVHLNGRLIGEQSVGVEQQFHAEFDAPYEPGELRVTGLEGGAPQQTFTLRTAGQASVLTLSPDVSEAPADRQQVVFVGVALRDSDGVVQDRRDRQVRFRVTGPAEIIATGNADLTARGSYATDRFPTYRGRAQSILRSTGAPGVVTLTAQTPDGLTAAATIHFHN